MNQKIPIPLTGDENGYEAWLRYRHLQDAAVRRLWKTMLHTWHGPAPSAAISELDRALPALLGLPPDREEKATGGLTYCLGETGYGPEGFRLTATSDGCMLTAEGEAGLLYGTFALLRYMQLGGAPAALDLTSTPYYECRMLNHWDDPKFDHTLGPYNVTRGFAGNSIFDWEDLTRDHARYLDYARLLASIGINAVCINNVNADPDLLETGFLPNIAAMADRLRPYNIRLYLSVCFSAPMVTDGTVGDEEYGMEHPFNMRNRNVRLGTLDTADPRDERVQQWWKDKADEIYALIPDFGGFVIKANSEGMPGPQDYGLTHADGANCVARALAPHGGTLFWRTFVYGDTRKDLPATDPRSDGCCQPCLEFIPLDGTFDDNVILQTKNGPADFRADEPSSPLLGAVPGTRQAVEFMIAQEYLGQTTHVCYQADHWHGILQFDTHQQGDGSTVAAVTAGRHGSYHAGAMVGVTNFGDDANWFGHLLAGANAYAFGMLAWNPDRTARELAQEWTALTFGHDPEVNRVVNGILNSSYPVFARYAAPLGMGYMHEGCHHFEPSTRMLNGRCWNESGAGFDRTVATGSQYIAQYHPAAGAIYEDAKTCPVECLLFFHHLPWDYTMPDGRSLACYMTEERIRAVESVREWLELWRSLQGRLDAQRWAHVYERLQRQYVHAGKWRDALLQAMERVGQYGREEAVAEKELYSVMSCEVRDLCSESTSQDNSKDAMPTGIQP